MPHASQQLSIAELGQPLRDATFLVVDLETTGGASGRDAITEVGAVKVRGGEVVGEFQTLVNPLLMIDPYVQVLTGITDRMVATAPTIAGVLPAFLEFAALDGGAILVAHNARFDVGFLKAAAKALDTPWPRHRTVDTVLLARRVLARDEVRNHKLGTLAAHLGARTTPTHRALDDARATVDVLHALLERVGSGVRTVEELLAMLAETTPAQRAKRSLADGLPTGPGVYIFRDAQGAPLYVGKSSSVRRRVRSYFTASEPRARMREMVRLAARVDVVECAHDLEAQIRELRLIDALAPRYNRRSKHAKSSVWLRLTDERFPRLSVVSRWRADGSAHIGPFGTRRAAEAAMDAVHEATLLRRCTDRITTRSAPSPCALAELGKCSAPCTGQQTPEQYAAHVAPVRAAATADPEELLLPLLTRIEQLAAAERFEDAAKVRDRAGSLLTGLTRVQQLTQLGAVARMVLAAPAAGGRWDIVVVAHGRLTAAAVADRTSSVLPIVRALEGSEQHFGADATEAIGHEHEETRLIARWMVDSGARLVELTGELASHAKAAERWSRRLPSHGGRAGRSGGYDLSQPKKSRQRGEPSAHRDRHDHRSHQ